MNCFRVMVACIFLGWTGQSLAFSGGSGTEADPYLISTAWELHSLHNDFGLWNKHFKLTNDISLVGYVYTKALIAWDSNPNNANFDGPAAFSGSFDGDGYAIKHLNIYAHEGTIYAGSDYIGLFGMLTDGAIVKRLVCYEPVIDISGIPNVNPAYRVGVICGYNEGCIIQNCRVMSGRMDFQRNCDSLGMVCGYNGGYVQECVVDNLDMHGFTGAYIGGCCGYNSVSMSDCYTSGSIDTSNVNELGGLCGRNHYGNIAASVSGTHVITNGDLLDPYLYRSVGGFCGRNTNGTISNCYAFGNVTVRYKSYAVGGFCGQTIGATDADITIENCYSAGTVDAPGSTNYALFCGEMRGSMKNCFWDSSNPGIGYPLPPGAGIATNVTGMPPTYLQDRTKFTGWQFVPEHERRGAWILVEASPYKYPTFSLGQDGMRPFIVSKVNTGTTDIEVELLITHAHNWADDISSMSLLRGGQTVASGVVSPLPIVPKEMGWFALSATFSEAGTFVPEPGGYDILVTFSSGPDPNYLHQNAFYTPAGQDVTAQGTIALNISPSEAVAQGGQWRLDGGSWMPSGAVVTVEPGTYVVEFSDIQDFKEPIHQVVLLSPNQDVVLQAEYTPLVTYEIDQLWNMPCWHDSKLEFMLAGDQPQFTVLTSPGHNPAPQGPIALDPGTGYFSYVPADEDVFPFDINFSSDQGGKNVETTVEITPNSRLPGEYTGIDRQYNPLFPDQITLETYALDPAMLNGEQQDDPCEVHLFGNQVTADDLAQLNGLTNIQRVLVYAEQFHLNQAIHIPQADVHIFTRRLHLGPAGSIKTTATNLQPLTIDGLSAGNIVLAIESLTFEDGQSPAGAVFILDGEDGTGPGRGGLGGAFVSNIPILGDFIQNDGGQSDGGPGPGGILSVTGDISAWLHPIVVRGVLQDVRNRYLEEDYDQALLIATEYAELLKRIQRDHPRAFAQRPADMQRQLCQLQTEFDTLSNQLYKGLDYFGNPRDWTPMLSFEANVLAFNQEVDRALSVFYLCRWVEAKNDDLEAQQAAIADVRAETMLEINVLQGVFTEQVTHVLPTIQEQLIAIGQQQDRIQKEIVAQQFAIGATAQVIGETKETIFTVLQFVSKGLNWGGQIVGSVGELSDLAEGDDSDSKKSSNSSDEASPTLGQAGLLGLKVVGNVGQVAGEAIEFGVDFYKQQTAYNPRHLDAFTAYGAQWAATLDDIDLSNVDDYLGAYVQDYQHIVLPASEQLGLSDDFVRRITAPQNEAEKELQRLADQTLGPYLKDLDVLVRQRAFVSQQLINEVNRTQGYAAQIGYNLTVIEQLNAQNLALAGKLKPHVVQLVQDMKLRARDTLVKYAYNLARAYEYRMLSPYPGSVDLTQLDGEVGMFTWNPAEQGWSEDMLTALGLAYKEDLNAVLSSIYEDYINSGKVERSSLAILELTNEELILLNDGQPVSIELMKRNLFSPGEEAIRLTSFEVRPTSTDSYIEGVPLGNESCKIRVEHSGESMFRFEDEVFRFSHYNAANEEPVYWQSKHITNGSTIDEWFPEHRSFASDSLLVLLLSQGENPVDADDIMFYSRPAAWTTLTLTKADMPGSSAKIMFVSLAFDIDYDYYARTSATVNVRIRSTANAHIKVSEPDLNGRQDGLGDFVRIYPAMVSFDPAPDPNTPASPPQDQDNLDGVQPSGGQIVHVTAPVKWGSYAFEKWTDSLGNDYGITPDNPQQFVFLYEDISLVAQYHPAFVSITGKLVSTDGLAAVGFEIVDDQGDVRAVTDEYGVYNCITEYGWSGSLEPVVPPGETVIPATITFDTVQEDLSDQDFVLHEYVPLAPPQGIMASKGVWSRGIRISWQSQGGNEYYRLYRSTSPQDQPVPISPWQTETSFLDIQVYRGHFYVYTVRAADNEQGYLASDFSTYDVGWLREGLHDVDFNDDTAVNLVDFAVFVDTWMLSNGEIGYREECDLHNDNTVDARDLVYMIEYWLWPAP